MEKRVRFSNGRFTAVLRDRLHEDYPNPDRLGCPGRPQLLSSFERRGLENLRVLRHLMTCSACFTDYVRVSRGPGSSTEASG